MMTNRQPPIVVVGGGTAGCTVVSHLAARTSHEIVLVEPGPVSGHDDSKCFHDVLADPALVRRIDAMTSPRAGTRRYCEARALGGGSAINGLLLSGDPPHWLESMTRHARPDEIGPVGRALLAAGGEPCRLWWNGGRWNPGRAVAHLVEEGRVRLVHGEASFVSDGERSAAVSTATEEIEASIAVMCAGSIATPALLLGSGFDRVNPAIGLGLQNHPVVSFALSLEGATAGESHGSMFDASVVLRRRTDNGRSALVVGYERASSAGARLGLLSVLLMEVDSRGRVNRRDGGTTVDFNVLATGADKAAMCDAVRHLAEVARTPEMAAIAESVFIDDAGTPLAGLDGLGSREFESWVETRVDVASHASSSCASAVNDEGRLAGTERIRVADASVLREVPNCTPAAPVTMEARRIAQCIEASLT